MSDIHLVYPYDAQIGKAVKIDPMRCMAVDAPTRLVGTSFSGTTKDTNFWTEAVSGTSAAVTQANQAILINGTDSAGYACLSSVRSSRYSAGSANLFRAVVHLPAAGLANHLCRWGAFTVSTRVPQNGYFFETTAANTLNLNYVNNNSTNPPTANRVASSSWTVPFTLDTNAHTYEIWWTNSKIWWLVDDVLRHTTTGATAPMSQTNTLPINLQNISISSTTSFTMNVRVASIYRFGYLSSAPTYKNITTGAGYPLTTICKYGAGILHALSVNSPTAATQTAIVYDNTSAATPTIGTFELKNGMGAYTFGPSGIPFNTGLTVVTSAACDITVVYE